MRQKSLFRLILPAALLALSTGSSVASALQRTFATPQEAAQALLEAAEANDPAAVMNIFGPEADEILNSGPRQLGNQTLENSACEFLANSVNKEAVNN